MKPQPVIDAEWDVLPPEEKQKRQNIEPLFRWLALIMDNLLRLPGTRFRFGLDPIIGLLPGIGDTTSSIISAIALIAAARRGLPKILLVRMSFNILLNEIVGIIPIFGDAFSFWFKSNARNYELIKRHTAAPQRARKSDWLFVGLILGALLLILFVSFVVSIWLILAIGRALGWR
ncbi:MAG TPA: DUF4112 domain-containing protein [Chthoniobacterales bacterium]|nr:DUF4112 domain-containing protein [Chthoniobacterales bacterium]